MSIWKTDKVTSLAALSDFQIFYFDEATVIKTSNHPDGNIVASFENFTPGDIDNFGSIEWLDTVFDSSDQANAGLTGEANHYDPSFDLSPTNNPYNFYDDNGRMTFRFFGEDGNVSGDGFLIKLTRSYQGDPTGNNPGIVEDGEYRVFKSQPANGLITPGIVWLCNLADDSDNGLINNSDYSELDVGEQAYRWEYSITAWNDAKVTINKANFWGIDPISSE